MKESEVEICWLITEKERDLQQPSYETVGAAGMDVQAGIPESLIILPGEHFLTEAL